MATKTVGSTGHEGLDSMTHDTSGSLTGGDIAQVTYDDTKGSVEIITALRSATDALIQFLP